MRTLVLISIFFLIISSYPYPSKSDWEKVVYNDFEEWSIESNDIDNDGICNNLDNCPETYNPLQEDFDFDNIGDGCDGLSINETTEWKKLIRIIDLLGREVKTNKGFHFEIYDDGSVDKKYRIKTYEP